MNAQTLLSGAVSSVTGPLGWGLSLTAAIYVSGGASGGHVNPAVTIGLASIGRISWEKCAHYIAAQYLGAFAGSALTYFVYLESLTSKYPDFAITGVNGTAGIFGTIPTSSVATCFLDQTVAASFFLLLIAAITDEKNMKVPTGLIPFAIGFTDLTLIIFAFGYNCGAPINPARDFAPRLLTSIAGWGSGVFR